MKTGILKTGAAERRELILNGSIVRTLMMLSFPTLMMSVVQSLSLIHISEPTRP